MLKILVLLFSQNSDIMTAYHDYLIVLLPSEGVAKKVQKLKDFSYSLIGEYDSHYAEAHITVQYWPAKKSTWVEPLIPKLERELQTLPPVLLTVDGFDIFGQQDHQTIYAALCLTPLTDIWFKQLRNFFNRADFKPCVTIAKSIPAAAFAKLWPCIKNLEWKEQFEVEKLTVLRRETIGYNKSYKVFKEIPFNRNLNFYETTNSKLAVPPLASNKRNYPQISLF